MDLSTVTQYLYFVTSLHWTGPVQSEAGDFALSTFLPSELCQIVKYFWLSHFSILIFALAPAAAPPPTSVSPLSPQVVQFIITVYLYRAFGRKAALTRSTAIDNSDHAHLEDAPEDDLDYTVQNDGYIDPDSGTGTWPSQNRVMSPGVPVKVDEPHNTTINLNWTLYIRDVTTGHS